VGEATEGGIDGLLDAVSTLRVRDIVIETAHGKTVIKGVARYQLDREQMFDAVKGFDGWAKDIVLDVEVERQDVRGYHTVGPGETLASIAERYLGSTSREMAIFEANRDRMNDPDQILPGQQLLIPWR
jgi:nucleoid-associated protein YgaU